MIEITPSVLTSTPEGTDFTNQFTVKELVVQPEPIPGEPEVPVSGGNITYCTVTPSHSEDGVDILVTGINSTIVTVTISGAYDSVFNDKLWQYKPTIDDSVVSTTANSEIPESFFALTRYRPDNRSNITITYNIETNLGSGQVTKLITNDWSTGLNTFLAVLNRQEVP